MLSKTSWTSSAPCGLLARSAPRRRQSSARFLSVVCKRKAVMSPLSNSKMSPFAGKEAWEIGEGRGADECQGSGSGGGDPGRGEEAAGAAGGGGATRYRRAPDQAAGAPLSGARRGGSGVRASGQAAEQRHRRGSSPGGCGSGAGALPGFRADIRAREAGGGARSSAVGGDAAPVDDRGWPMAREGAAGHAGASESAAAGVRGGLGADRRFAARLVRATGAGLHADRVRGRRDDAAVGDGVLRRGDARCVHEDDAGASGGPRPAGGTTRTATACSGSTKRTGRTS